MKKYFLIIIVILFTSYAASAQIDFGGDEKKKSEELKKDTIKPKKTEDEKFWSWSKVRTGGGLGLSFGTVTYVNISPTFGYQFTNRYQAGVGVTYIYYQDERFIPAFRQNIYGGSVYNKFNIYKEFVFGYAEYEALNSNWDYFSDSRFYIHNLWVGGGLNYAIGARSAAYVMALWNINDSPFSPFQNPAIRIGFGIGF